MEAEKTTNLAGPISFEVTDWRNNPAGTIELSSAVFDAPLRPHLLHEVVVFQEAKHRAGRASTKRRGEVAGSNRKLYRQKGTGRARAGELRSPLRRGGGVVFGPKPRDYEFKVGKKIRKAALRCALSSKRKEDKLLVVDDLKLDRIKTQAFLERLSGLGVSGSALLVISAPDRNLELSARNLRRIKVLRAEGINVRDVLLHERLIMTREAALKVQERLS